MAVATMVGGRSGSTCLPAAPSRSSPGAAYALRTPAKHPVRNPLDHGGVYRHAFAGRQHEGRPDPDIAHRKIGLGAVGLHHECATRGKPRQSFDRLPGAFAHDVVERSPDQQEEQQRNRSVEIGVRAMLHRLVELHAEGEQHAERDRHIHIGAPMLQGLPCRTEEYSAGVGQRRQRNDRRQPMKQVAGFGPGARPVRKGEVVGIVGANALGKTTFMKMLAGVDKPDSGNLQIGAKISYKPQYLNQEYDGSVKSILSVAYENEIEGSVIEEQILAPIGLKKSI